MCAIRSHLPHRSHSNFLRRTSWICTRPSPWALRVYVLRSLRSRAFIHGSRPQQWTSWQHIWPTVNPPQTRKQGTTANALATTPPLPSWGARPLLPLTTASLPQEPTTQLDLHPISLMLTSLNFRNWRMMFSSTVTHLNAGITRFLSNSASLQRTGPHPSLLPLANGGSDMRNGRRLPHALGGICRTPTKTDFLRQTLDGSADDPTNHHPFYSCPTAIADRLMLRTFGLNPPRPTGGMTLCGSWAKTFLPRRTLISDRRQMARGSALALLSRCA
jgi:hypothetical protein